MATVLTLGEALGVAWTDVGDPLGTAARLSLSTAGAEATVAIGLCRLGHTAIFVSRVGADAIGERIRRDLRAEGVNVRFLHTDETAPSGFMLRDRASSELLTVTYYRSGSAASRLTAAEVAAAVEESEQLDLVHVTGVTACLSDTAFNAMRRAVQLARSRQAVVSVDVNLRRSLPTSGSLPDRLGALLRDVDVLFVGDDELHVVAEDPDPDAAARTLLTRGPHEVVIKRGAAGATAYLQDGSAIHTEAFPVTVADVVGAGDSFVAGYLSGVLEELPVRERLRRGALAAALTVGTHGDWQGLPFRADLDRTPQQSTTLR